MTKAAVFFVILAVSTHLLRASDEDPGVLTGQREDSSTAKVEQQTFALINHYRVESGLPPFKWNDAIADEARVHSSEMASGKVEFGHDGFGDRMHRLKAVTVGMKGGAENVFMADNSEEIAAEAVKTWLGSPHHLENIRGDYLLSGIGLCTNARGECYFTQIFLKIENQASPQSN